MNEIIMEGKNSQKIRSANDKAQVSAKDHFSYL